jgi:CspA family cold shock protein
LCEGSKKMLTGKIKHWNKERGFGFIAPDDGGDDIFAHCRDLVDRSPDGLPIGARVRFDLRPPDSGHRRRAIKVEYRVDASKRAPRELAEAAFRPRAQAAEGVKNG